MENFDAKAMLEIARETAKIAGDRLKLISQRRVNSDAGNDVKLQEDVESEMFIRDILSSTNIPVIGEERGGDAAMVDGDGLYWVVDPIDGTYNYLRNMPGVCVSIGLMRGKTPVVGAIYDFTRDELFLGGKGFPLTLNGVEVKPKWASDIHQAVLMTGFPSASNFDDANIRKFVIEVQNFKKIRMVGSACVAMAWVAVGRADAYIERRLYLWDVAAGLSLMESAGAFWELKSANIKDKPLCVEIKAAADKKFFLD